VGDKFFASIFVLLYNLKAVAMRIYEFHANATNKCQKIYNIIL